MQNNARVIPIVAKHQAAASEPAKDLEQSLYEVRRKIYPRALHGWFAGWRWAMVWLTQLIFYGLPWLQWNGRQIVLFDLGARKFYLFGFIFWPQDFIYLTLLLICSALSLFLFTAVGGRLWCGYACPQTVYTEIFLWIERKVEGNHHARARLDKAPLSLEKFSKKLSKHSLWIVLSLWTGLTFVGYFTPIRSLLPEIWTFQLGGWEIFWILFYGFATYGNAGWMREQVCKYMCPYARFQSAMFDKDTLIITYDVARGEPRGSRSRQTDPATAGLGHCVDCGVCVQVCPTGIDIRKGLQYECIGCAACIDGCNQIMEKMNYPKGLIRYSTENALAGNWSPRQMWQRVFRPRVLIYTGILWSLIIATGAVLVMRSPLKVDVIRDRGALAREVEVNNESGWIENVYRLQIMNQSEKSHRYVIRASSSEGWSLRVLSGSALGHPGGSSSPAQDHVMVEEEAASSRMVPVIVQAPPFHPEDENRENAHAGSHKISFTVVADDDPSIVARERSVFLIPH